MFINRAACTIGLCITIVTDLLHDLQEVLHALCDKNRKLPKRPSLTPPHGRHLPVELVTLMQQCWHQVSSRALLAQTKEKFGSTISFSLNHALAA